MSISKGFIILTLCLNTGALAVHDRQQVLELASTVCPYTNFCSIDALTIRPNDTDKESCCLPCSCDDDCWVLDNCCPDKVLIDKPRPPILPCVDSYVKSRSLLSNKNGGFYRVIDSCPCCEDMSNFEPKCSRKNRTFLEDFVWVSDTTGRIYLNIHCAKCHGISESVTWQIQATCSDILTADFVNVLQTLVSPPCNLLNTPPNTIKSLTTRYECYRPSRLTYTTCDKIMKHYNPDIADACEESTWPYIIGPYLAKNVFCLMCAAESPISSAGLCYFLGDRGTVDGYTLLLDYTSLSADPTEEDSNCGMNEIFDDFLGICRQLLCPFGRAAFYGRCKQIVSEINGLQIRVEYCLDTIANSASPITNYGSDVIGKLIYLQFLKLLNLTAGCEICQIQIYDYTEGIKSMSVLSFVVAVQFTPECDYGLAFAKLSNMRGKLIKIDVNETTVLMVSVRSDNYTFPMGTYPKIFEQNFKKGGRPVTVSLEDGMTCPRVELTYTDQELFSHSDIKRRIAFASFFVGSGAKETVARVSICLDEYNFAMSQINRAATSDGRMTLYALTAVLSGLALFKQS